MRTFTADDDLGVRAALHPPCWRSLLLVIDGRTGARAAIAEAVALAQMHDAHLWLASGSSETHSPELGALMRRQALRAARRAGVPVVAAGFSGPCSAADLCRISAQAGCDLIVIGVPPSGALRRLLAGNLVPRLITASPVPVLVVPDCEKGAPRRRPRRPPPAHLATPAPAPAKD